MDDRGTFKRKVRRLVGLARSADWLKVVVWTDFLKLYECYVRMEDAREKYWGLYRVSQDCHTLILGSSHAYHGFYAEGDEYNLGDHSLNFYYAGKILKYWLDFGLPKLKNVVLFCDIFSGGDILEQSSEAFRAAQLHNLYGIEYQYGMPMVETLGVEFRRIDELYAAMRNKPVRVENDYRGNLDFDHVTYDFPKDLAEERVGGHLKIGKGRTQVKWLDLIARGTKGKNLVLVVPPVSSDYMRYLPSFSSAYQYLLEWLEAFPAVQLCNLWNSHAFTDGDFGDIDHLNEHGARKLSNMVRSYFE